MHRLLAPLTAVAFAFPALHAQAVPVTDVPVQVASLESLPAVASTEKPARRAQQFLAQLGRTG